jgi:hypothetical protein
MVQLGDKAKDKITGFTGTVVAITRWINNCERATLQPPIDKDGKLLQCETFDVPSLEVIEAAKPAPLVKTGGPRDDRAALRR